ncbi:hypothetical protein FB451DRAFT_1368748 [Mycena latifolia]|nr:hypothetical protein FB451DRAFT_1368748 [Mycena latifolia]
MGVGKKESRDGVSTWPLFYEVPDSSHQLRFWRIHVNTKGSTEHVGGLWVYYRERDVMGCNGLDNALQRSSGSTGCYPVPGYLPSGPGLYLSKRCFQMKALCRLLPETFEEVPIEVMAGFAQAWVTLIENLMDNPDNAELHSTVNNLIFGNGDPVHAYYHPRTAHIFQKALELYLKVRLDRQMSVTRDNQAVGRWKYTIICYRQKIALPELMLSSFLSKTPRAVIGFWSRGIDRKRWLAVAQNESPDDIQDGKIGTNSFSDHCYLWKAAEPIVKYGLENGGIIRGSYGGLTPLVAPGGPIDDVLPPIAQRLGDALGKPVTLAQIWPNGCARRARQLRVSGRQVEQLGLNRAHGMDRPDGEIVIHLGRRWDLKKYRREVRMAGACTRTRRTGIARTEGGPGARSSASLAGATSACRDYYVVGTCFVLVNQPESHCIVVIGHDYTEDGRGAAHVYEGISASAQEAHAAADRTGAGHTGRRASGCGISAIVVTTSSIKEYLATAEVPDLTAAEMKIHIGIPYAQPPIGPLRFQSPQPCNGTVVDATSFKPACLQFSFFGSDDFGLMPWGSSEEPLKSESRVGDWV